jgi:hypothetical protein
MRDFLCESTSPLAFATLAWAVRNSPPAACPCATTRPPAESNHCLEMGPQGNVGRAPRHCKGLGPNLRLRTVNDAALVRARYCCGPHNRAGSCVFPPITERRMRFAGLALQVLGTGFGFLALMETRQLFRLPSFADSAREWIKRRPRSQVVVPLTGTAVMTSAGSAKLSLWSNTGPELDTAQRINAWL